jgi:putative transposase
LKAQWVPQATRDAVVDYIAHWTKRTELSAKTLLGWLGLAAGKFHQWKARYGRPNEHNARAPRDDWLADWEQQAILDYHDRHPLEGYRRLTFMMLDEDVVAVSPSSVYRVLKRAGRLDRKWQKPSKKGQGFVQPLAAHDHWHVDVSYLNLGGTFYYLCSLLDGYSRLIVHWEIRDRMTERDIETIVQRGLEKFPDARPRIISDNGPQFIARDFKEFIRLSGITHVRTSPYYPQSNGKLERWHGTLKGERFRLAAPANVDEARRVVEAFVVHYNEVRLHSALGYITPNDKLAGREKEIFAARDRKLEAARKRRCRDDAIQRRQRAPTAACEKEHRERLAGVQGAGNEAPRSPEPECLAT